MVSKEGGGLATAPAEISGRARPREAEAALAALWSALDELAQGQGVACGPDCPACCTDRVQATGLEARVLAAHLRAVGRLDLLAALVRPAGESVADPAARPAATMNALARLCLAGLEPPPEPAPASAPGVCPLLEGGLCQAYAARPLACRVMLSARRCPPGGWAEQDPWWVSLGAAFFQLVEQASAGEPFGLLGEVLASLEGVPTPGLPVCENLPGIPAPPEHQARLGEALGQVFARPCLGRPLGWWLQRLRVEGPAGGAGPDGQAGGGAAT
jgi:hypothetical protein